MTESNASDHPTPQDDKPIKNWQSLPLSERIGHVFDALHKDRNSLQQEIARLNDTVQEKDRQIAALKQRIVSLTKQIAIYRNQTRRQYEHDHDYLPYEEDEDRR
jgi:predicted  nucleic acid-binding Zn-ribbon protein